MTAISTWDTTAANNNATAPDGWSDGMAPNTVDDTGREMMAQVRAWYEDAQWIDFGHTIEWVSATQFKVSGIDLTSVYEVERAVKIFGSSTGTIYRHISASVFSTDTTVTIDSGTLINETLTVSVGIVTRNNNALPNNFVLIRNYISGLIASNGSDATNDIDITVGQCMDSTNTYMIDGVAMTKQIDAIWVAGTNNGGYGGAGALSAGTFHFFLLYNPDDLTVDYGFDDSLTASNILADAAPIAAGLTHYRRLYSVIYDGATILGFTATETAGGGLINNWSDPPLDVDVTNLGTSAVSYSLTTPLGIKTVAHINVRVATLADVYISALEIDDEAPNTTAAPLFTISSNENRIQEVYRMTDTSSQIRAVSDSAITSLDLVTYGYEDFRRT